MAPWADLLYYADARWWKWHQEQLKDFKGIQVTIECNGSQVEDGSVYMLRNLDQGDGVGQVSTDPRGLCTGRNSGYQAINLAYLAGSRRIVLLGYDGKRINKKSHWFGDHPAPTSDAEMDAFRRSFRDGAKRFRELGIEILNASPDSAIDAFPRVTVEEALG